jgi:hypothetical protein
MISASAKPVELEPLSGLFDARSPADAVPFGVWRYLQNMEMTARRKLRRAPGWEKLLSSSIYNNEDFHDQLTGLSAGASRQPITLIHQLTSPAGISKLLIGTSKRLAVLNNDSGNWRIISDLLGNGLGVFCEDQGWRVAQVGYTVVLTNGLDTPVYYVMDQPPIEPLNQSVDEIDDLDEIGLTMAKVAISFKGIVVFGNVTMDGERFTYRLVWSDADRPLSWVPADGTSAAGFQDLGYGEDILEMMPLGDSLLVYTSSGIWEGFIQGGSNPLVFRKRYADHTAGNRCLAYRRTLVTTGSDHYYMGRDGIYRYNFYTDRPIREEWMHVGSSIIFDDLSTSCHTHCAGYNAKEKSLYFSWAANSETCPGRTMVFNTEYESDYVLDHGFTAFANYNPDDYTTLRDFLIEQCICTVDELDTEGSFVKDGGFCVTPDPTVCNPPLQYLYTDVLRTIDDIQVEDWDQSTAHANSLCASLGSVTMDQFCSGELDADECNAEQVFVAASATDFALKQIGTAYSRERVVDTSSCGAWTSDGYTSIMRSGPLDMKAQSKDKLLRHLLIDLEADAQAEPSDLKLRIGASYQPADPNSDRCSLRWFQQTAKPMTCPSVDGDTHRLRNTRQNPAIEWPLYMQDRYFVVEFSIEGTGGAVSFSKIVFWVEEKKL